MIITKEILMNALKELGVEEEQHIMVHTSLSSFGSLISGGTQTVIESLLDSVGKKGTIMMPTQSWKNLDPETGVHGEVTKDEAKIIRETWPAYNKKITPTNTMGSVAEMFRSYPGTNRSNHPSRSVAANGFYSQYFTSNHDLSDIFGLTSPLQKLYEKNGYVLLIGVGYDKNTSIHLADELAKYPSKHTERHYSAVEENGVRVWQRYETLFVDGEDFEKIGEAFEKQFLVKNVTLGEAVIRLMPQRELVDFSVKWIEENRE
ncbi:aminoglycoside N(3)-acetyltransferase [Vagococcus hydrophili]|nr:AAC(3) family N-acetyltransferase [Vagococcus hydrophili]